MNSTTIMYDLITSPANLTDCEQFHPDNTWCGVYGAQRIIEIIYMIFLCVVGVLGNLLVICSIVYGNRLKKHGNIFIVNLAFADLIVTGLYAPTVVGNVITTINVLSKPACMVAGFTVLMTCTCSITNLTLIAANRYLSVIYNATYKRLMSNTRLYVITMLSWVWSFLVASPTLLGWGGLRFDNKMQLCSWDDEVHISYNVFATVCAIIIPVVVICCCYLSLFREVRSKRRSVRRTSTMTASVQAIEQRKRSIQKELNLLRTLSVTVLVFVLCWLPFGVVVLFNPHDVSPQAKKISGWLGLSNSCVNFMIYGLMNPVYREGYNTFILFLFCQKSRAQRSASSKSFGSMDGRGNTLNRGNRRNEQTGTLPRNNQSVDPLRPLNPQIGATFAKADALPTAFPGGGGDDTTAGFDANRPVTIYHNENDAIDINHATGHVAETGVSKVISSATNSQYVNDPTAPTLNVDDHNSARGENHQQRADSPVSNQPPHTLEFGQITIL